MSECNDETLRLITEPFWFGIGRDTAAAYAAHEAWLYRRVETIEFIGRHSVKRSISVDFEVPKNLPSLRDRAPKGTRLVPISVLHKWPSVMNFDFTGPTGHPTSRYIVSTNKQLDFGLLLGMADRALALGESIGKQASLYVRRGAAPMLCEPKPERLTLSVRRQLAALVQNPQPAQTDVARAVNGLRAELNMRLSDAVKREALRDGDDLATRIALTVDLAARLADSSILWVAAHGVPGTDTIVKFSYIDKCRVPEDGWRRWAIACSWKPRTVFISLPHAGRHVRYHLDIPAPRGGVEPVKVEALAFPAAPGAEDLPDARVRSVTDLARAYATLDQPDEWVGPDSSLFFMDYGAPKLLASTSPRANDDESDVVGTDRAASVETSDRRTHAYLGARSAPSHRVFLLVTLAGSRQGFIRGCTIAAAIIAAVMTVVYLRLTSAMAQHEATVVLLSVVPVVLGYVLVKPDEDGWERYHITGVRVMALVSGAMPIAGALTVIATKPPSQDAASDLSVVRPIWLAFTIISWAMAGGLIVSSFRAAGASGHGDDDAGTDSWR